MIYLFIHILIIYTKFQINAFDFKHCKVSHNGIEYEGNIFKTESGIICQSWSLVDQIDFPINDDDFVEGSKVVAKNYCRNPNGMFDNPWCYTTNPDVSDEICDIKLCNSQCRITMVGAEYGGNMNTSITNRMCLSWSEKILRKFENQSEIVTSDRILENDKFPEHSRKKAGKRCRNPTGDINGPWCFVEDIIGEKEVYEKEYCDIQLCSVDSNCTIATSIVQDQPFYNHFIKFTNRNSASLKLSIQLWNLADFKNATLKLGFFALPVPLSGSHLKEMNTGIELYISQKQIGFVTTPSEKIEWHKIPHLLSGLNRRNLEINWLSEQYYMSVSVRGYKNIDIEYQDETNSTNETIMKYMKGKFSYYSIQGDPAVWSIPCTSVGVCEEHTTLTPSCTLYSKMKKTDHDYSLSFFARSSSTIIIQLRNSPSSKYPYFRIDILTTFNKTTLYLVAKNGSLPKYLASSTFVNVLSYWSWSEFYLSAIGDRLYLVWVKQMTASETLFDIRHPLIRNAKWYSICSETVAHWTFECHRSELIPISMLTESECTKSATSATYVGTISFSKSGKSCLPWIYPQIVDQTKDFKFIGESRIRALNYCRNPNNDQNGPFCYVANNYSSSTLSVKKEYCDVPICQTSECKISGTGAEYNGNVRISRSNRTCKLSNYTMTNSYVQNLVPNVTDNYCQNPDGNQFGPWCYTTDSKVKTDLCNLSDCSVNEWITTKFEFKIKTWDPHFENALAINFIFTETTNWFYSLYIGRENQTKVELFYVTARTGHAPELTLLKEKIIPRLIPAGYWQGYWLRVPPNAIELGFEGSGTPIFSWPFPQDKKASYIYGTITLISFNTLEGYNVGLNFPCSYCFMERTMSPLEDSFYPINLWSESNTFVNRFTIHMRSTNVYNLGKVLPKDNAVTFIKFYDDSSTSFLNIKINYTSVELFFENPYIVLDSLILRSKLLKHDSWTTIEMEFSENHVIIKNQFMQLLKWNSNGTHALRFYYFTVISFQEITTWVANCQPPDLDYYPVNGGWSEWSDFICNVPCGGGYGFRKRTCNNPRPTYRGLPCIGLTLFDIECNRFECGCMNPMTIEKAKQLILTETHNINIEENTELIIDCELSIISEVQNNSPGSYVQWLKDGFKIPNTKLKLEKLDLKETNLKINNIQEHHAGVYMCIIYPDCVQDELNFVTTKIIAVTVNAKLPYNVRKTTSMRLICNSPILQVYFSDLSQSWELNGFLYIDYIREDFVDVNFETVDVDKIHEGLWLCKITENKLNLTWITSKIKITVTDPPTLFTYLTEEDGPSIIFKGWNPILIILFLYSVIIIEIVLVAYVVYWFWKTRTELLRK